MKCRLTIAAWFSTFFEKPLVRRVNRRIPIRIVRFCRSTIDVEMSDRSGLPEITRTCSLVAVLLILIGLELVVAVAHPLGAFRQWGGDYSLYMEATRRWLAGGSFYQPWQFAPYVISFIPGNIGTTAILYPPYALALLVPFAFLPAVLWWAVPIGIITVALYPVSGWRLVALLAAIATPVTWYTIANGNPALWSAAFLVAGTRWRWPAVFVLLKPTLAPFALVGIRSRAWWVGAVVLAIMSVVLLPLTLDYIAVLRNARGPEASLFYSVPGYLPLVLLWVAGRKETPAHSPDKER